MKTKLDHWKFRDRAARVDISAHRSIPKTTKQFHEPSFCVCGFAPYIYVYKEAWKAIPRFSATDPSSNFCSNSVLPIPFTAAMS